MCYFIAVYCVVVLLAVTVIVAVAGTCWNRRNRRGRRSHRMIRLSFGFVKVFRFNSIICVGYDERGTQLFATVMTKGEPNYLRRL